MSLLHKEENGIHILQIDRERALNALNVEVMDALYDWFVRRSWNPGSDRAIIITGKGGKAFAAGADISEFPKMSADQGIALSARGHEIFNAIENCRIPVIAAVNGFALGGGCELAMACHIRIASEHAKFGQPEVKLGLVPGYGGTQRLIEMIGRSQGLEMLLTGEMIDADKALQLGLVSRVVPGSELMEAALRIANKIGAVAPLAVEKIIKIANAGTKNRDKAMHLEQELFGRSFETVDAKEGVTAFMEKRKADFKGK
jgi:enoyl-CoA hydratase